MDLSTLKPVEREIEIRHPRTREGTGLFITISCTHDAEVQAAIRAVNDRYFESVAGGKPTHKQIDDHDNATVAACIKGFRFEGDADWKGEKPSYSPELAKQMCEVPTIKEQVGAEVKKVKDFYKA